MDCVDILNITGTRWGRGIRPIIENYHYHEADWNVFIIVLYIKLL
jgi:hypothetical protein